MHSSPVAINLLRGLVSAWGKRNSLFLFAYIFVYYLGQRLHRLLKTNITWCTLPDEIIKHLINEYQEERDDYIDCDSCVLANTRNFTFSKATWFYVCSKISARKYKVLAIPFNDAAWDTVYVSEVMRHNLESRFGYTELNDKCFLLLSEDDINFATETKVSLIVNPHDYTVDLASALLENYFVEPRFLRKHDIFGVTTKDYIRDHFYSSGHPIVSTIYFKVNSIKCNDKHDKASNGCYVARGETTLIQEPNVHSYLPRKHVSSVPTELPVYLDDRLKRHLIQKYPPVLEEPLQRLEACILPFVKNNIHLRIKPIFLIKGPQGCGKRELIKICSQKIGFNLLSVDFAEVQTLTSAQTEAKLRIVLQNARRSIPCILCLSNIQVFGKNTEGQKDERTVSAFSTEINALYEKDLEFPVIVIATANTSFDLPAELERVFIETISMDYLDSNERAELISWLLSSRGLNHRVDLSKLAGVCSDFRFSDLIALTSYATKIRYKLTLPDKRSSLTILEDDFLNAYEYMQLTFSDHTDVPRIPKVHWEDIGGLAELKREIIRRIQLPLLNDFGFGQSGILLYGPPGTGKTMLAKAVATEYQLRFLSIKGPEVLNMYVGQSEKNVRQVFERARATAPCIIFFDELDSLAPNRGRSGDSGGVMDRVVSQLLAEMDGLEGSSNIFIIGATNRPDLIDPALLRPGRFDKMLYVGIHSDRLSRLSVLRALTRKFKLPQNGEELEEVANRLPEHVTGADLYAVCSDAWLSAARRVLSKQDSKEENVPKDIVVELQDFLEAIRELVPSVSEDEARRYERMHMELSSLSS